MNLRMNLRMTTKKILNQLPSDYENSRFWRSKKRRYLMFNFAKETLEKNRELPYSDFADMLKLETQLLELSSQEDYLVHCSISENQEIIDYFLNMEKSCLEKTHKFRAILEEISKRLLASANTYHNYYIQVRDSMDNKYYGNGVYLHPLEQKDSDELGKLF